MVLESTEIPGKNGGYMKREPKKLCYGKAETLEDTEEAARWWRYNLLRYGSGLRCCDVGRSDVVVTIRNWAGGV
jgi:hypothetical protein